MSTPRKVLSSLCLEGILLLLLQNFFNLNWDVYIWKSHLWLTSLYSAYALAAHNIKPAWEWENKEFDHHPICDYKVWDMVLLQYHSISI